MPAREKHLASNTNVGGPTTAAAMAQVKNWKGLVLPVLLVGILGDATATAIALVLGAFACLEKLASVATIIAMMANVLMY